MSDNYLVLIPTDPTWQADEAGADRAGRLVDQLAPEAEGIDALAMDEVEFFDAGENFERARCPLCGADVTEWWPAAMDAASELAFADLSVTMPCCGRPASLNELAYEMPQGFASFALVVTEPGIDQLDGEALRKLGEAIGHPLRAIWQRL